MAIKKSFKFKLMLILSLFVIIFSASIFFFFTLQNRASHNEAAPSDTYEVTENKYNTLPTVIIDAGHGGEDGGAIGINGVYEKDLNLAIALELEQMLSSVGVKTRLTRSSDMLLYDRDSDYHGHKKSQDAAARISISEEYEDAVFISIHMNSFSQSKYKGLQVYYSENSPLSAKLAETVQMLVAKNLQPENTRKIKSAEQNIYILSKVTHPAILIECGFITNPEECEALSSPSYRSRLCMVLYSAIMEYLENKEVTT